jgi:hypothetical protein
MNNSFIILRRELTGYSTRGPIAVGMSLDEARAETVRLKSTFPYQDFVIMCEVGAAKRTERVTVKIDAPDLGEARKRRLPRRLPANVVPLRSGIAR